MPIENDDNIDIEFNLTNFDNLITKVNEAKSAIEGLAAAERGVVNSDNAKYAQKAEEVLQYANGIKELVSKISSLQGKLKEGIKLERFDTSQVSTMVTTLENAQNKLLSFTTAFDQKLNAILGGTNFSTFTGNAADVSLSKVRTLLADVSRSMETSASAVKDLTGAAKDLSNVKAPTVDTSELSKALSIIKEINKERDKRAVKSALKTGEQFDKTAFQKEEKRNVLAEQQKTSTTSRESLEQDLKTLERERDRLTRLQRRQKSLTSPGGLSENETIRLENVRGAIKTLRIEIKATPIPTSVTGSSGPRDSRNVTYTIDDAAAPIPKSKLFPNNPDLEEPYKEDLDPVKKKDFKKKIRNIRKSSGRSPKGDPLTKIIDQDIETYEGKLVQALARETKSLIDEYSDTEAADEGFIRAHRKLRQKLVERVTDKTFDLTALTVEQRKFAEQIRRRQRKLEKDRDPNLVGPVRFSTTEDLKYEKERDALEREKAKVLEDRKKLKENLERNKPDRDELNEDLQAESNTRLEELDREERYMRKRTTVPNQEQMKKNDEAAARVEAGLQRLRKQMMLGKIPMQQLPQSFWNKPTGSSDYHFPDLSKGQIDLSPGALNRAPTIAAAFNFDEAENKLAHEAREFVEKVVKETVEEGVAKLRRKGYTLGLNPLTSGQGIEVPNVMDMTGFDLDKLWGSKVAEGSEYDIRKAGGHAIKVAKWDAATDNIKSYEERVKDILTLGEALGHKNQLIGKYKDPEGNYQPIFSQKWVEGREANEEEIVKAMKERGFEDRYNSQMYTGKFNDSTITLDDLHGGNVIIDDEGRAHIIDAEILRQPPGRDIGEPKFIKNREADRERKIHQARQSDLYPPSQQQRDVEAILAEERRQQKLTQPEAPDHVAKYLDAYGPKGEKHRQSLLDVMNETVEGFVRDKKVTFFGDRTVDDGMGDKEKMKMAAYKQMLAAKGYGVGDIQWEKQNDTLRAPLTKLTITAPKVEITTPKVETNERPKGASTAPPSTPPPSDPPPGDNGGPPDDDDPNKKRRPTGKNFEESEEELRKRFERGGFSSGDIDFNTKFGASMLALERQIRSQIKQMESLSKAADLPGFEDGRKNAQLYAQEMFALLGVVKDLDEEFAQQDRTTPSEKQVKRADALKRDFLEILRISNSLKDLYIGGKLKPPGPNGPDGPDDPNDPFDPKLREKVLRSAAGVKTGLNKVAEDTKRQRDYDLENIGAGRTVDKLEAKTRSLIGTIEALENAAARSTDNNILKGLLDYSERLKGALVEVQTELESVKAKTNDLDKIKKNLDPQKTIDRRISNVDQLARSAATIIQQFNAIGSRGDAWRLGLKGDAREGITETKKLYDRLKEIQDLIRRPMSSKMFDDLQDEIRGINKQLDLQRNKLSGMRAYAGQFKNPGNQGTGSLQQIGQGLGIPFASRLPLAFAIGFTVAEIRQFITVADQVFERVSQITSANRQLAASAMEIGYSYSYLNEKNATFSNKLAIGRTEGTELTAKVAQLAGRTQKPENIDKLMKGFADLAAARGLQPEELKATIQQIISGQDEGYKKLGLRSPGQVYEEYAQKRGRTAADLTPVEKSQIFEEAFLKKSEIFSGSADARLNSLDGKVGKLKASWTDLMDNFQMSIASNYEVGRSIEFLTKMFGGLNTEIEDLVILAENGLTEDLNRKIKDLSQPGYLAYLSYTANMLASGASGAVANVFGTGLLGNQDFVEKARQDERDSAERALSAVSVDEKEAALWQQVQSEFLTRFKQREGARDRQVEIGREQVEEQRIRQRETETAYFKRKSKRSVYYQDEGSIMRDMAEVRRLGEYGDLKVDEDEVLKEAQARTAKEIQAPMKDKMFPEIKGRIDILQRFLMQVRKEKQAIVDELNKPLFNEEQKQELLETQRADLLQVFEKRLSDKRLKPDGLFDTIKDIKANLELLPEMKDKLLATAEEIRQGFALKLKAAMESLEQTLIGSFSTLTSNPLLDMLKQIPKAGQDAYDALIPLGEEIAEQGRSAAEAAAKYKFLVAAYQNTDRAVKARQEARRLQAEPEFMTGDYKRRMAMYQSGLDFVARDREIYDTLRVDRFNSEDYNPYGRFDNLDKYGDGGRLESEYGVAGLFQLSNSFEADGRKRGENAEDYEKRIEEDRKKFIDTSVKIDDYLRDFGEVSKIDTRNLGLYGQEKLAEMLLKRLPTMEELAPRLKGFGDDKAEAEYLLDERTKYQEILQEANVKRYEDAIAEQEFIDFNKQDVLERLNNLDQNGGDLNQLDKVEQALSIMNELGNENLDPEMRQRKIGLLGEEATIRETQRAKAEEQMAAISGVMAQLKDQITKKGLAVDLGDQVVMNLNVNSKQIEAETENRPSQWQVNENYSNGYTGKN